MQGIEKHINYIMNTIQQMQNIRPSKQLMAQCLLKVNSLGRKKKKKRRKRHMILKDLGDIKTCIVGILIEYYFRKYQETWGNFNTNRVFDAIRKLLFTFFRCDNVIVIVYSSY